MKCPVPQALLKMLPDLFPQGAILLAADVPGVGEFQRCGWGRCRAPKQ